MKQSTRDVLGLLRVNPAGITDLEALRDAGCRRLAARIWDLKQDGYAIITESVETYNGKRIARYRLADEAPTQLRLPVAS